MTGEPLPILVGVDGSEGSRVALAWALEEGEVRRAPVVALYAWTLPFASHGLPAVLLLEREMDELKGADVQAFEEAVAAVASGRAVERRVVEGLPARALVEASEGAQLLVLGSRGRGGFATLALGSVALQCAGHARCPVAIVPARVPADAAGVPARALEPASSQRGAS